MLINRMSLLVLLLALTALASAPVYERVSWRGKVPEKYRDASEVTVGNPVEGALERQRDESFFVLRSRPGRLYTLDLTSEDFDPMVRLEGIEDGKAVPAGSDDDGGDDTDAQLTFCGNEDGGLYVITVASVDGDGDFELSVAEEEDEACREGQAFQARLPAEFRRVPRVVRAGAPAVGRAAGGPDHWVLEASPEHLYTVDVTSSDMDPALEVYFVENRTSSKEGENDDSGGGTDAHYAFCAGSSPGLYVMAVRSVGSGRGAYTLSVEDGGSEPCEPGVAARFLLPSGSADVGEVRPGVEATGFLRSGDEVQHLLVTTPGRRYEVTLRSTSFDAYLRIRRALVAGSLDDVATDDDGGGGRDAQADFCAESVGAWVAEVSAFGDSGSGAYTLLLTDLGGC